jgi:hypothetical protein
MPSCAARWLNRFQTIAHSLQTVSFWKPEGRPGIVNLIKSQFLVGLGGVGGSGFLGRV